MLILVFHPTGLRSHLLYICSLHCTSGKFLILFRSVFYTVQMETHPLPHVGSLSTIYKWRATYSLVQFLYCTIASSNYSVLLFVYFFYYLVQIIVYTISGNCTSSLLHLFHPEHHSTFEKMLWANHVAFYSIMAARMTVFVLGQEATPYFPKFCYQL